MSWRARALLTFVLGLAACAHLSTAEQGDIRRWLLCEECVEGELARVRRLDDRAVGELAKALEGPSPEGRANMRRQAEAMHARVGSPAISAQGYADHYESNYIATYQLRATRALTVIGTPRAHAALIAALQGNVQFRPDVRRALGAAAGVTLSVAGDGQDAPVDSILRVDPVVQVQEAITGQGLANLRVEFRVDSGGGAVSDSVRLTDSGGRAAVQWRMGDSATVNVLRAVAGGRTVRIRAFSHVPRPRLVFLVQPGNSTPGQPLTPAARIAVQDAWGATQTGLNQSIFVEVIGTAIAATDTLIGGEAFLTGFTVPFPGSGMRLRVQTLGAEPAVSAPFDVVP